MRLQVWRDTQLLEDLDTAKEAADDDTIENLRQKAEVAVDLNRKRKSALDEIEAVNLYREKIQRVQEEEEDITLLFQMVTDGLSDVTEDEGRDPEEEDELDNSGRS
jgi:hypothetical protein